MVGFGVTEDYRIPPLVSGGVILSYRCTNACRHCLYRCSPTRPDEWMTMDMAERVFDALAAEPMLRDLHLAGGEATLRFDRLLDIIRLARSKGIRLAYLETNAAWCVDRQETRAKMELLRDAGLPGLLVSASMFHNEFIPFDHTRNGVEVGRAVFGEHGVMVWLPHLYDALGQMPDTSRTHTLKAFCEFFGLAEWDRRLPELYGVIPGGQAVKALRRCYPLQPWSAFKGMNCREEIERVTHFHIDLYGNLITGFCWGLASGSVEDLHPAFDPEKMPINRRLLESGPAGLAQWAMDAHGFAARADGYVSKCDLCFHVRESLHAQGPWDELRPADMYAET